MNKSESRILALCCLFLGIVIGFLISPIKKGIEIGNNAGNTTNNYRCKKEETKE
jgi:hypothetical protein